MGHIKRINYFLMRISCFLLACVPILEIYTTPIPFVTLGEIVLVFVLFLMFFQPNLSKIYLGGCISLFFVYTLLITLISIPLNASLVDLQTIKEIIGWLIYAVLFFVLAKKINIQWFLSSYVKVAVVASLFLCIQYLLFSFSGRWIPGIIPGLSSSVGGTTDELIAKISRPTSFFSEPAHFAQFLAIPFSYVVFNNFKKVKHFLVAILFSVSLLLNRTGNGFLVLAVIGVFFIIRLWKSKKRFLAVFLVGAASIILAISFNELPLFRETLLRVKELSGNGGDGTYSGYIRIVRGYVGFANIGFIPQVFGLGIGIYHNLFAGELSSVLSQKTPLLLDYVNGVQYYLLSSGVIGFGLLLFCIVSCALREKDYFRKSCSMMLLAIMLIAALYTSWLWLYFLLVLFVPKKYCYSVKRNAKFQESLIPSKCTL